MLWPSNVLTVDWDSTHGPNRPFLPSMVRKNDSSAITSITTTAFTQLKTSLPSPPSPTTILEASKTLCELKGVGPATSSLLLSVHSPEHVPFFQDESYAWLVSGDWKRKDGKLKYNVKEYKMLTEAVSKLKEKLEVGCAEVERVAYVLGHWEMLNSDEREGLEEIFRGIDGKNDMEEADEKERPAEAQLGGKERKRPLETGERAEGEPPKKRPQRKKAK
jgi:hypothetical protein